MINGGSVGPTQLDMLLSWAAISDAHEGIKAAASKVLCATWQRCRVHFARNVLAHAGKSGRRVVSAFIGTAFAQDTPEAASSQWRNVADQIRTKVPKLAAIMDEAEHDVLAYMNFPKQHWTKMAFLECLDMIHCRNERAVRCLISFGFPMCSGNGSNRSCQRMCGASRVWTIVAC